MAETQPDTRVRCANCETDFGSYRIHRVNAVEQVLDSIPDGTGMTTVIRAVVTCSWRCLAVVAQQHAEPDEAGVAF